MKKKPFWLFLIVGILALVLAACAGGGDDKESDKGKDKEDDKGTESAEGDTKEGGDLVLAVQSDAKSLDPAGSNDVPSSVVQANIYETLVNRNDNNEIEPSLAESWEAINDTTWEFKLRKNVKFHDGTDFNAEAVKMNLDRILDPKVASPRLFLFEMVKEINVVDEHTVQIVTEYPFAPLLAHLSHNGGGMASPAVIEKDYAGMEAGKLAGAVVNEEPVGTGFFKFSHWKVDDEVKLVKNDDYWGDKAHVDSVTFRVVPENGTRLAELENDFVHITDPVLPNDVKSIDDSSFATVFKKPSSSLSYIGFNTQKKPFDDVRVRQAISMMIDRQEIIDGIYEGYGIPANGPLAPGIFAHNPDIKPIEYNLEEAKKLLAEAGFADGFSTTIWTNDSAQRTDTAVMLQHALKEVNIDVKIEQLEWGAYLDKTANGEHDMFILGWSNPTGDADYGMYALFHSSQHGEPGNRSFYNNSEVDKLLDEGRRETDPDKRVDLYKKAQDEIAKDAPMVFIHHQEYLLGISNSIEGFDIDTSGIYQLKNVKFKK